MLLSSIGQMMTFDKIQSLTYADLYPAGTFFAPRTTLENTRWVVSSLDKIESITGFTSCLMGDMPLICHRAVATPPALELIRLAGLSPPSNLLTYRTEAEAISLARQRLDMGERLIYIYPPSPGLDAAEDVVVPVKTYGLLNDKRRISEFISEEYLPNRRLIRKERFGELIDQWPGFPVYVKAGVEGANGGGVGVQYCHDEITWREAVQWFQDRHNDLSGLVVEEEVDVQICWCLGVSILDAGCHYLGGTIQLFDKPATQVGNRIDPDFSVPDEAIQIALIIADAAKQLGYRGIAGFDIGMDANNKLFVFDLNFRLNSSTNQLILHSHVTQRIGARASQSWQINKSGSIASLLERLVSFVEKGVFIPFRMFDQETFNESYPEIEAQCVITGVIVADSVSDIEVLDASMKQALK